MNLRRRLKAKQTYFEQLQFCVREGVVIHGSDVRYMEEEELSIWAEFDKLMGGFTRENLLKASTHPLNHSGSHTLPSHSDPLVVPISSLPISTLRGPNVHVCNICLQ